MTKQRKPRSDSISEMVKTAQAVNVEILPPEGIELDQEESVVFGQISRARRADAWRPTDLGLIAKAAQIECTMRKHRKEMADNTIIENKHGTKIVNPLFTVIDQLHKQQMSIYRLLSLGTTSREGQTLNAGGQRAAIQKTKVFHPMLA